jgi:hypothetical protein
MTDTPPQPLPPDRPQKNTGKAFEEAVARFVQAVDPRAEVIRNYMGRDKDTGERQQMDVLVRARLMGHFPQTVLISCKDYRRLLHAGDVRTFRQELTDSSANSGVLYASNGFNANALKKAAAAGIVCCRLYRDQPAELPASIALTSYAVQPVLHVPVLAQRQADGLRDLTWDDVLDQAAGGEGAAGRTVLEEIQAAFDQASAWSVGQVPAGHVFPPGWQSGFTLDLGPPAGPVDVVVRGGWRRFRARREAHLVDGSYCLTDGNFAGKQTTPALDATGELSADWVEMAPDEQAQDSAISVVAVYHGADAREGLRRALAGKRLADSIEPPPAWQA